MSLISPSRCLPAALTFWRSGQEARLEVLGLLLEHLGVPDDGVERRPQLVGHVRQELRLVLAGDLQLAARLLDLLEQPGVLDRQHRLAGERLEQVDDGLRELAGRLAADHQRADRPLLADQRDGEQRAEAGPAQGVRGRASRSTSAPSRCRAPAPAAPRSAARPSRLSRRAAQAVLLDRRQQLVGHLVGGPATKTPISSSSS